MRNESRNLRKAAILVASLDPANAESLLRQMSPAQAHRVRQALEELGPIDPREQSEVIEEFFRLGPLLPAKQPAGIELDGGGLPELTAASESPMAPAALAAEEPSRHGVLHEASVQTLAPLLEHEHPQTIAVVISSLPAQRAAEVLAGLSGSLQIEVARRLVELDGADPEIVREVERGLEARLQEQAQRKRRRTAGVAVLNSILSAANGQTKQHILANLSERDPRLANTLERPARPLPTFADVEGLEASALRAVLRQADREVLLLALAGAGPDFAARALELFPVEEAQALRRELRHLGPMRLSDIEQAQAELVELARQLESRGQIALHSRDRLSVAV